MRLMHLPNLFGIAFLFLHYVIAQTTPDDTTPLTTISNNIVINNETTTTVQPSENGTTNSTDEELELSYVDKFILRRQMVETIDKLSCQLINDGNPNFVQPSPCLQENVTEDGCLATKCCYLDDPEEDEAFCIKKQPVVYIYSKLSELSFETSSGVSPKQISNPDFVTALVQCVVSGERDCAGIAGLTQADVNALIFDVERGDGTATEIFRQGGLTFIRALVSAGLINIEQFNTLRAILPDAFPATASPTPFVEGTRFRCFWYPWGGWSNCQGVCGVGVQTRIRRCQGCVPGTGACQGSSTLRRGCPNPVGQNCAYWSSWSGYNPCSYSCGPGIQTRTRRCLGGRPGEAGCVGVDTESLRCNTDRRSVGNYLPWTTWTTCSVTCGGGGSQSRSQQHTCNEPRNFETRRCNAGPCCGKLFWSQWSACSATCGRGTRTRRISDVCPNVPDDVESISCDAGSGSYGDWSPWQGCSATCSGGTQIRQRAHSCFLAPEVQSRSCGGVGGYTQWTAFGSCSSSCPGGEAVRTRRQTCTNEIEREVIGCGREADYSPWGDFSGCSGSCFGTRSRRQFNPCGLEPRMDVQSCGSVGDYSPWGPWGMCSQSCLGGLQVRTRIRPCDGERRLAGSPTGILSLCSECRTPLAVRKVEETQTCGSLGSWGVYSEWTACDRTCGNGQQFRTRIHSCPDTLPENERENGRQARVCSVRECCRFNDWTPWSECQSTCGYGISSRQQVSTCNEIDPIIQRQYCFLSSGQWTEWGAWGDCSQTCVGGRRSRTRTQSCTGSTETQQSFCGADAGYGPWSIFSACTRSCGGGFRTRVRQHICGTQAEERDVQPCNTEPGSYLDPSPWSRCSRTCAGGAQTRTSQHNCGLPVRVQRQACGNPGTFLLWGNWGPCSTTCMGTRVRFQRHQCTAEFNEEREPCGSEGDYGPWGFWSFCTSSCAGGSQSRRRVHLCNRDVDSESRPCGRAGFFGNWGFYGRCSQTCGGGVQRRQRRGICGFENESEERACGTAVCCFLQEWSEWTACPVTCGFGQQRRQRFSTCSQDRPVDNQVRSCNAGNGVTSQWTLWTTCPVTCGSGRQTRSRTNTCATRPEVSTRFCSTSRCPFWSTWSAWSACSASCFQGDRTRRRECFLGVIGVGCIGESTQTVPCSLGDGSWLAWGAWSACSASCAGGFYTRTRLNSCGLDPQSETGACNTSPGGFGPWALWSACSQSCGGGTRVRNRIHTCTGVVDNVEEVCNAFEGAWLQWTAWSVCSRTCAGGTYTRRRSHTCGLDDETETGRCNTFAGQWQPWSPWTTCPVTCGGGTQSRTRSHTCGLPDETGVGVCGSGPCPFWSGWTAFGDCSVSCGSGIRDRTRRCENGLAGLAGCLGESIQRESCDAGQGDLSPWTEFSPCTTTCGGGSRARQRQNTCESSPQFDTQICNTDPGQWNNWSPWTVCSAPCGGGQQSRSRSHSCDLDDEFQSRLCNTDPGSWSEWSTWTTCSATCGNGINQRERTQSCTGERETNTRTCQLNPCAIWGGWSTWGPCSTSCGPGSATRSRQCQGGLVGTGFCFTNIVGAIDSRVCDSGPCCDFDWSGWSACCRPNFPQRDISIQIRYLGNGCGQPWEEFNRTCPVGLPVIETSCTNLGEIFEEADNLRGIPEPRIGRRKRSAEILP